MKKIVFNILKYLFLLAVGVFIFWLVYKNIEVEKITGALKELNYFWIVLSVVFGLLSQLSRAMRWKMLIKPLGYNPRLYNTFLSVLVLYFANLIVPRAGEVARCGVLTKTDKIPFPKLVGTVFVERLADMIMLMFLAVLILSFNIPVVRQIVQDNPKISEIISNIFTLRNILLFVLIVVVLIISYILLKKRLKRSSKKDKIVELKDQFIAGIKSIASMKGKWIFIAHTTFIFLMWLVMLYVVFLAYQPTSHLSVTTGAVVFLMGGLAMVIPIQGGLGLWHWIVAVTLVAYGIEFETGKIFAFIAHSFTNLIYILFGGIAAFILVFRFGSTGIRFSSEKKEENS